MSIMSHASLINHLTLFYQTLAALRYISSNDIISPPTSISLTAAHEAGLSSSAIELLQRLPQLSDDTSTLPLLPDGTQPVIYCNDENLDWSRTPTYQDSPEIAPSAFVLTNPNIYGTSLIYDTVTQKLLPWEAWGKHVDFEIGKLQNPFELDDAKPAEQVLGPWIKKLISLEWVCFDGRIVTEPDEDEISSSLQDGDIMLQCQTEFIQWSFRDVYLAAGWDVAAENLETARKDFDDVEFARMEQEWMDQTRELLDIAYEQQWPWQQIRIGLGGELATNERARLMDVAVGQGQEQRHIDI